MSPKTDLTEPQVDVLGMDADSMKGFDHAQDRFRRDPRRSRSREERGLREPRDRRRAAASVWGTEIEASLVGPHEPKATPPELVKRDGAQDTQGPPGGLDGRESSRRVRGRSASYADTEGGPSRPAKLRREEPAKSSRTRR